MKPTTKTILFSAVLAVSIGANFYLAYCLLDAGITRTYQSASFETEHRLADTLSALLDSKRSLFATSDLKSLAQKRGWDSFSKKTDSAKHELLVVNGVGFRVEMNKVLAVNVNE
jgi:hypothetical protein